MQNESAMHAAEQRQFPRFREAQTFALEAHADTASPAGIGSGIFFHKTQDISQQGLCFQQNSGLSVGTQLKIFFLIPETLQMCLAMYFFHGLQIGGAVFRQVGLAEQPTVQCRCKTPLG